MTLWHVLVLAAFLSPLCGSLSVAHRAGEKWLLLGLAVIVGLLVGSVFAWTMSLSFRAMQRLGAAGAVNPWHFRVIYIAGAFWIVIAALVGSWLTQELSHHI